MKKILSIIVLLAQAEIAGTSHYVLNNQNIQMHKKAIARELVRNCYIRLLVELTGTVGCGALVYKVWQKEQAPAFLAAGRTAQSVEVMKYFHESHQKIKGLIGARPNLFSGNWFMDKAYAVGEYMGVALTATYGINLLQNLLQKVFYSPSLQWYIASHTQFHQLKKQINALLYTLEQGDSKALFYYREMLVSLVAFLIVDLEKICGFMLYRAHVIDSDKFESNTFYFLQQRLIESADRFLIDFALYGTSEDIQNDLNNEKVYSRVKNSFDLFIQDFGHVVEVCRLYENQSGLLKK